MRRFRIPALLCSLAVLVCELISHPYAAMGICDDGPYIVMTRTLATTGHLIYNGWATPILGWQLFLGAALIKLFGFSFTTVRMSTLLVAMALAFVLQRTLVRAGISERNATIGTLALVLSPLYLMLSVTFVTDIDGLFAIVLCLYGCLRALQASTPRAMIGWLCFAVAANAICGTSRQIAWLGILVIVPSALWLLRAHRRVFIAGAAATLAGAVFLFSCMYWFSQQPYIQPEHLLVHTLPIAHTLSEFIHTFLDVPFLLLPIAAMFIPQIRRSRPRVIAIISAFSLGYILLAIHWRHSHPDFLLEPTQRNWLNVYGLFDALNMKGDPPLFLHTNAQILLTVLSVGGLIGVTAAWLRTRRTPPPPDSATISRKQLATLLAPFTLTYILLLIPRAATDGLVDRYMLELMVVAVICLVRYYQDRIHPQLPTAVALLVGVMAVYGIALTHNMFALYRARVDMAAELQSALRAAGVPDTAVDGGWEHNFDVELQHANYINDSRVVRPAHAYVPTPPLPAGTCPMAEFDNTPHIHPVYGVSFDPNACYGPAPFAPLHYSRWLSSSPGTLYVVRYTAQTIK